MSGKASWKTWVAIVAVLIATGLITALWPLLINRTGGQATTIPTEMQTVEIPLPLPIAGSDSVTLTALQVVGILALIIGGAVVAMGIPLALIYTMLSRQAIAVGQNDEFKAKQAALEKRQQERIKQLRQGRTTMSKPGHEMPRWSALSTALIILLFAVFFGMVVNATFVPEGELMIGGRLINSALVIVASFVLVVLPLILWIVRPQKLEALERTDRGPIPWDFIAVLLTGLVVVGLGIGILVYLNVPA